MSADPLPESAGPTGPAGPARPPRRPDAAVGVIGLVIGLVYLLIGIVQHQVWSGVVGLLIMIGYAALTYGLRGRSETAQLLSGNTSDERQRQVLLRASSATGNVLIGVILLAALVGTLVGWSYAPAFAAMAAIGGFTFMAAVAWYSHHL